MGNSVTTADGKIYNYYPVINPEVWLETKLSGTASATSTVIGLDPKFLACVTIDGSNPVHAIATLTNGPYDYIWVEKGSTSVTVHAPIGATFDVSVSAKVIGKDGTSYTEAEMDYKYGNQINITTTLSSMYVLEEA